MRVSRGTAVLLVVLMALAVLIAVSSGWRGAVVFAFFAALAFALARAAGVGGAWLEDTSRGRFERRDR